MEAAAELDDGHAESEEQRGMGASELASRLMSMPRDTAIIIECHPALAQALHNYGLHVVHVGMAIDGIPSVHNAYDLRTNWSRVTRRVHNAACLATDPEIKSVVEQMTRQTEINTNSSMHRAKGWVRNMLRNLQYLRRPTGMQIQGLENVPAFIVGAGSSLDLNHHLLDQCKRKGIVVAINGANRACAAHAALTVESNDLRYKLGDLSRDTMRLFGMTSAPEVMAHGDGPLFPIYSGELALLLERLTQVPRVLTSATGGAAALSLVERWGCNPVVLVGQDFHVTHGGLLYPECLGLGESRCHVDAEQGFVAFNWDKTLSEQPRHNPLNLGDELREIDGVDGGQVYTTVSLLGQIGWFSQFASRMHGRLCINASEAGALMPFWKHGKLSDVLSELPERDLEVSVPQEGVGGADLFRWVRANVESAERAIKAAKKRDTAALLAAVTEAPLIEAWCYPEVFHAMKRRRTSLHTGWLTDEYDEAQRTLKAMCDGIAQATEELREEMVRSQS